MAVTGGLKIIKRDETGAETGDGKTCGNIGPCRLRKLLVQCQGCWCVLSRHGCQSHGRYTNHTSFYGGSIALPPSQFPASNLPFAWAPAFPGVKLKVFSACGGCMCPSLQWPGPTIRSETEHFPLCSSDIQISNSGHFQVRGSPSASHCFASLLNQFSPSTSPPQKRCVLSPLSTHTQPPTAQLLLPSPKTFPPIRLLLLLIHSSPFSICNSTTLPYLYPRSRPLLCPRATHSSSIYS